MKKQSPKEPKGITKKPQTGTKPIANTKSIVESQNIADSEQIETRLLSINKPLDVTDLEYRFCIRYATHSNASKAYRETIAKFRGRNNQPCTNAIIATDASRMLNKPNIKECIAYVRENIEAELQLSQLKVMQELSDIAFADAIKFHDADWNIKPAAEISGRMAKCIKKVKKTVKVYTNQMMDSVTETTVELELYSKLDALKSISNLMGYNAPKKVQFSGLETEQELINELKRLESIT